MMRKERGRETEGKGQGGRGGKRRGERGGGATHNFGVCVPPPFAAKEMEEGGKKERRIQITQSATRAAPSEARG